MARNEAVTVPVKCINTHRTFYARYDFAYDGVWVLDGDKCVPHIYDYFRDVRLHPNDAGFATYGMVVSDAVAEILNIRPRVSFI